MDIVFREDFDIEIYGFSGVAVNQNWADTGIRLSGRMWEEVKSRGLPNEGLNVWVYEQGDRMFAGVGLKQAPPADSILECKKIHLAKYAWYKHIGAYDKIGAAVRGVMAELEQRGIKTGLPYLEIYGHWTPDADKLETELLWSIG